MQSSQECSCLLILEGAAQNVEFQGSASLQLQIFWAMATPTDAFFFLTTAPVEMIWPSPAAQSPISSLQSVTLRRRARGESLCRNGSALGTLTARHSARSRLQTSGGRQRCSE